jgi:hypothetical protein
VTLQAAIAWVATRDAAFTFSFQDMNLEKMDALILRAGLSAVATVQGSWVLVRDAIAAGKMNAWGQKFELPANFELGDVWPRGPEEPLSGVELTDMNLVDVRGMAVHPNGIPCVGQTWYCRILIQKDHLQSQFPPRSAQSSQIVERPRDYQLQATIDVLRELTPADIQGIRRDRLLDKVNAILVEERQTQKIAIATLKRALRKIRSKKI